MQPQPSILLETVAIALSLGSLVIALIALRLTSKRLELAEKGLKQSANHMARSAELQALVQFRTSAKNYHYSDGIERIATLSVEDWREYKSSVSEADREKIRGCVEHLNFVANLVDAQHIKMQTAWDLYFMSYRLIANKLEPWWFEGMSDGHPNRFSATRRMAKRVMEISEEEIEAFDRAREISLDKK
jgi:hypothetical protein